MSDAHLSEIGTDEPHVIVLQESTPPADRCDRGLSHRPGRGTSKMWKINFLYKNAHARTSRVGAMGEKSQLEISIRRVQRTETERKRTATH